ncbi:MAG TPA: DNA polymerase, partial [Phycisphaerales bacterium]|nr:DNA polymerase [Phycisphaerales bacterium]
DVGREIRRAFVAETTQRNWLNGFEREASAASSVEEGRREAGSASLFASVAASEWRARTRPPAPSNQASGSSVGALDRDEPNVLITADYSQIELRLLAHLADDPALIDAFHKGLDIHTAVAAEVFDVPPAEVSATQRNSAKMVNFGIIYGITPFGLARRLQLAGTETTNEEAGRIIADYKHRYSGIAKFLQACIHQAMDKGYVETVFGRRRPIPEIHSNNPATRALGERYAINTVVQGSAADLIKIAMIDIERALGESGQTGSSLSAGVSEALARTRMLLQIHDELVFESPRSVADEAMAFVRERMQKAMTLKVPLVVGAAWSENWIDAK